MSAIAAIIERGCGASGGEPAATDRVRQMIAAARGRSDEPPRAAAGEGAVVAAAARCGAGERCLLHESHTVLVAADADLVQRDELRASLRQAGVELAPDANDAALIAAAWSAWGQHFAVQLRGDFAVIVVDLVQRICVAARDGVGRRPLHWGRTRRGTVAIGSTVGAVLAHPDCSTTLDVPAMAAMAAGLFEHPDETAYAAVRVVPAGHQLVVAFGREPVLSRYWTPPPFETGAALPFAAAAEELRAHLIAASRERLATDGPTAVWLSGGWDSTAVYGAGAAAIRAAGSSPERALRAVSMSYPVGDRGREDELIAAVAGHWGERPVWVQVGDVPLVDPDAPAAEAERDEPFAHAYDGWNGAMARATHAAGASVALDGAGGDQLFSSTPVFLADLVRRGRLLAAHQEARAHGVTSAGRSRAAAWAWWRWAVRPLTPAALRSAMGAVRGGRAPLGHLERPIPPWIRGEVAGLRARARGFDRRPGESASAAEARWYLTTPYSGRILAAQSSVALAEGVVLRSPLLDQRIVTLAATRPASERAGGGETKRLLRAAVAGLVPENVLATRSSRTGLSSDYFRRELRRHLPQLLDAARTLPGLAALGVVEPRALRTAADDWQAGRLGDDLGLALLLTLRTELWLSGRVRDP